MICMFCHRKEASRRPLVCAECLGKLRAYFDLHDMENGKP